MSGTSFALLVGCAEYQDPRFSPLQAPDQDVTRLRRVLKDPKIGDFTVDTLLDKPSTVVRPRIEEFFKNRKRHDLLLLYFSCHGNLDPDMQLYFVATDTTKELPDSTGITAPWVKKQMDDSRSERIVLLLDCCYSGAFNGRRKAPSERYHRPLAPLPCRGAARFVTTTFHQESVLREDEQSSCVSF